MSACTLFTCVTLQNTMRYSQGPSAGQQHEPGSFDNPSCCKCCQLHVFQGTATTCPCAELPSALLCWLPTGKAVWHLDPTPSCPRAAVTAAMLTWHLCHTCFNHSYLTAVQLLRFGANVHHAAASGATTPLHEAVIRNAVSTTELLLKAGANPFLENGQVSVLQWASLPNAAGNAC